MFRLLILSRQSTGSRLVYSLPKAMTQEEIYFFLSATFPNWKLEAAYQEPVS